MSSRARVLFFILVFAISTNLAAQAPSAVNVEPSSTLARQTIQIQAGQTAFWNWQLAKGVKLVAKFNVQGGLNNQVKVWLLDVVNYQLYAAKRPFRYFKGTSGTIQNVSQYEFIVPEDNIYYLVVDNGKAWFMPRTVNTYVYEIMPAPTKESLQAEQIINQGYLGLKTIFIFPDFHIIFRHCGVVNAFSGGNLNITICKELIEELQSKGVSSALAFVFYHELGHSLLRGWGYPLSDNEDVADEFATVMMIRGNNKNGALQAAQWWASDQNQQTALAKLWIDDRHTVSPQRARNIIHWLNNSDDLVKRWQKILVPNFQTEELKRELNNPKLDRELIQNELKTRSIASR